MVLPLNQGAGDGAATPVMSGPSVEVASILRAAPRPQNWSKNEVRRWLEAIELDVYAPTFEAAGVQGADLIGMDADALKRRLGVAHLGHRTTLLKEIAILANRATLSMRRGEESRTKDFVQKRKELLDTMYPDRVRREMKAQQDEKLLEARAAFWTPDNRKTMGAVDHSSAIHHGTGRGARSAAPTRKHHEENLIISESDHRHRTQSWGGHAAQQRATVRPVTAVRKRVHGAGARPRTAGPSRGQDSEAPISGLQDRADGHGEDNDAELRRCKMPSELMQEVTERIKDLEAKGSYDELIKAWVEYGACVRMLYSDKDKLLVRTHFNMATTYLRQKLVKQAIYHFQEADMVNQANSTADDALSFKCRIMEGMGICETRLGHLKAAEALLEQARRLCLKRVLCKDGDEMSDEELSKKIEELDIEEIPDEDGAVASVLVAKSELFSAQAEYDRAVECLEQAYSLKEAQLGDKDKQIGKLFSALGTIRQKQVSTVMRQYLRVCGEQAGRLTGDVLARCAKKRSFSTTCRLPWRAQFASDTRSRTRPRVLSSRASNKKKACNNCFVILTICMNKRRHCSPRCVRARRMCSIT